MDDHSVHQVTDRGNIRLAVTSETIPRIRMSWSKNIKLTLKPRSKSSKLVLTPCYQM